MSTVIMDERLYTSFFLTSLDQKKIENASTIRYHISSSETCKQWGAETEQYGLKIIFKVGFDFVEFCKFLGDFGGYLGGDSFSQWISEI